MQYIMIETENGYADPEAINYNMKNPNHRILEG